MPHTFIGAGPNPTRVLVGFLPMQFEGFLREVGQPAPARVLPPPPAGPPPEIEQLALIAKRAGFVTWPFRDRRRDAARQPGREFSVPGGFLLMPGRFIRLATSGQRGLARRGPRNVANAIIGALGR